MIEVLPAYELKKAQIDTPPELVDLFWDLLLAHYGKTTDQVLDMGAGDGRFAVAGRFGRYLGVEIDPTRNEKAILAPNASIVNACAFAMHDNDFDAAIGNPPYLRHHSIEQPWKSNTIRHLNERLGMHFNERANLFSYFIALGLIKTKSDGIVGLIIPYEWVSRPSIKPLRDVIKRERWNVTIYHLQGETFKDVLTTASISIIDKSKTDGTWSFFDVSSDLTKIVPRNGITGSIYPLLKHSERSEIWAKRGLSPGKQSIFCLTEENREKHGLKIGLDVIPCITTLKYIPRNMLRLDTETFREYWISKGHICWLIRSDQPEISPSLHAYLGSIPEHERNTSTCINQYPWYNYERFSIPDLLAHSGFTSFGPKVVENSIGAASVGSVYGIYNPQAIDISGLQGYLLSYNFEMRIVQHAKSLKKIEIKQLNTVIGEWYERNRNATV